MKKIDFMTRKYHEFGCAVYAQLICQNLAGAPLCYFTNSKSIEGTNKKNGFCHLRVISFLDIQQIWLLSEGNIHF